MKSCQNVYQVHAWIVGKIGGGIPEPSAEVKQILARFIELSCEAKGEAAKRFAAEILADEDGPSGTQRKDDERARSGYDAFQGFVHFVILTSWQFPGAVYKQVLNAIRGGGLSSVFKKLSTGKIPSNNCSHSFIVQFIGTATTGSIQTDHVVTGALSFATEQAGTISVNLCGQVLGQIWRFLLLIGAVGYFEVKTDSVGPGSGATAGTISRNGRVMYLMAHWNELVQLYQEFVDVSSSNIYISFLRSPNRRCRITPLHRRC